jgi:hypothetical protein
MKLVMTFSGIAFALFSITAAEAAKTHKKGAHPVHAAKMQSACKGEFMYLKGGKCVDARDKHSS